jgi:hypothetical protein
VADARVDAVVVVGLRAGNLEDSDMVGSLDCAGEGGEEVGVDRLAPAAGAGSAGGWLGEYSSSAGVGVGVAAVSADTVA